MKTTIKRDGYQTISETSLTETVKIPVRAGMENICGTGEIISYPIRVVGYDYIL